MEKPLSFGRDGVQLFPSAAALILSDLRAALPEMPIDRAGLRISGDAGLRPLLSADGPIGGIATHAIGERCRAVRAILFDKNPRANWSLGWHQDRTICVRARVEVDGFGPWTIKGGMQHVAPPFALLSRMVTLRVHLDDVPLDNGPLLVAPGSHQWGRIAESAIEEVVRRCGVRACPAIAGDVWLYATPILHASESAATPVHRRVLQIDFSAEDLPGGLEWLGV